MEKRHHQKQFGTSSDNIEPDSSSFESSDREQAKLRIVMPLAALLWAFYNPLDTPTWFRIFSIRFELHASIAFVYLILGIAIHCVWQLVYETGGRLAPLLRKCCLVFDVTAISIYSAVSSAAGVVLLPIYLSAIIGYGMRFGRRYLLAALLLSSVELLFVLLVNDYFALNTPLIFTYLLSLSFLPGYTLKLLKNYSSVKSAYTEASTDLDKFIEIMGHEFRAPLHSVISTAELCDLTLRKYEPNPRTFGEIQTGVRDILRCSERMLAVANQVATLQSGPRSAASASDNTYPLFRDVFLSIRICAVHAKRKGLDLSWTVDSRLPPFTEIESHALQEILINLIDNSIKNTFKGHVLVRARLLDHSHDNRRVEISIVDSGSGYSQSQRNSDEIYVASDSLVARKNSGLGLAIVRRQITHLSARLEISPAAPVGSRFVITLPVKNCIFDPPYSSEWLRVVVFTTRALTEAEQSVFLDSRLLPRMVSKSHGLENIYFREPIHFCVCLNDELEAALDILEDSTWSSFNSLPLILLRTGLRPEQPERTVSANVIIDLGDSESSRQALRSCRTFSGSTFRESALSSVSSKNHSILLVDDSHFSIEATQRMLVDAGYTCVSAFSLEEAVHSLMSRRFDLIVADRYVGDYDLLDRHLSEDPIRLMASRLILLSADRETQNDVVSRGLSVRKVLIKPLSIKVLLESVHEIIGDLSEEPVSIKVGGGDGADWQAFDDVIGESWNSKSLLTKFELEVFGDCLRCEAATINCDIASATQLLHRLEGISGLIGATHLASVLDKTRCQLLQDKNLAAMTVQMDAIYSSIFSFIQTSRRRLISRNQGNVKGYS